MSPEDQGGKPGPWILFPEIIGISVIALLSPLPLVHMMLSGQAFAGTVGPRLLVGCSVPCCALHTAAAVRPRLFTDACHGGAVLPDSEVVGMTLASSNKRPGVDAGWRLLFA
jgi:hypothetical protein